MAAFGQPTNFSAFSSPSSSTSSPVERAPGNFSYSALIWSRPGARLRPLFPSQGLPGLATPCMCACACGTTKVLILGSYILFYVFLAGVSPTLQLHFGHYDEDLRTSLASQSASLEEQCQAFPTHLPEFGGGQSARSSSCYYSARSTPLSIHFASGGPEGHRGRRHGGEWTVEVQVQQDEQENCSLLRFMRQAVVEDSSSPASPYTSQATGRCGSSGCFVAASRQPSQPLSTGQEAQPQDRAQGYGDSELASSPERARGKRQTQANGDHSDGRPRSCSATAAVRSAASFRRRDSKSVAGLGVGFGDGWESAVYQGPSRASRHRGSVSKGPAGPIQGQKHLGQGLERSPHSEPPSRA